MNDIPSPLASQPREPAAHMDTVTRRPRSKRAWDADHPTVSFRLDTETMHRLKEIQQWYTKAGYQVSLSQITDDLLWYSADAWEQGQVSVSATPTAAASEPIPRTTEDKHQNQTQGGIDR